MPAKQVKPKKVSRTSTGAAKPNSVAELNVQRMKLTQLKPHPRNPRKHPAKGTPAWEVLRKSLEHDYFDPLVWNERNGMLVSGHLRRKVFTAMGVKEADVVVVDYDEPTHLARMIAANKSIGEDDLPALGAIMDELGTITEFDMSLSGFTSAEYEALFNPLGDDDESTQSSMEEHEQGAIMRGSNYLKSVIDQIEKPKVEVTTGSVYRLGGKHILCCCDPVHEHALFRKFLEEEDAVLFVCPDPFLFGDYFQDHRRIIAVQPDPVLASYMLSTYQEAFGKSKIKKLP